jgi:transcriptional regulator with XRE-family HTH domain
VRGRSKAGEANEPHPVDIHVGLRLRDRRIELGISQQKLAAALGLSFQQVYKYERGANRISASRLYDLSKVLGVPLTSFFEGIADTSTPAATLPSGEHNDPLSRREAAEFFAAYRAISDPVVRRRLRQLVRALASEPNALTASNPAPSQSRRPSRRVLTNRSRGGAADR